MKLKRSCYFAALLLSAASPSFANELSGVWLRDTGEARVKFESCGDAMCGTIIWLKPGIDSKAKIGQRVFYDMKPAGPNAWTGKALGPDTGSIYVGKLSVQGSKIGIDRHAAINGADDAVHFGPSGPID
jgi:uncharacterized protein (DUF2147 family)